MIDPEFIKKFIVSMLLSSKCTECGSSTLNLNRNLIIFSPSKISICAIVKAYENKYAAKAEYVTVINII